MSFTRFGLRSALIVLLIAWLAGCASVPDDYRDPRDPWEPYNRGMFQFNTDFDNAFWKPVAEGYKKIMPPPVNKGVTNFFDNMRDFTSIVNNVLQLKLSRAASDVGRVLVNSTVGILGLIDVASNIGLPSYKEDFGQTLGYWGVEPGPYFVLPLLGPSSVRDAVSLIPDWYTQPVAYIDSRNTRWALSILYGIDRRADLLTVGKVLEQAALDQYSFIRGGYLQSRLNKVYDGNPPESDEEEYWDDDSSEDLGPSK